MSNSKEIDYLHPFLEKCVVCDIPCTSSCGACKKVGYCSKDHQQKHWKSHKSNCFPLIIKSNDVLGRYLVTTRDVKQGEVILKETPLVSGPHLSESTQQSGAMSICLSCFKLVQTNFKCSRCNWPLCGITCEQEQQHKTLECPIFAERNITPVQFLGSIPDYYIYEGVTALRGVLQKKLNPQKWCKILELQSHVEERSKVAQARKLRQSCIHFIRQVCGLSQCQEEEIDHVLGAIGVNAFVSDDGVSQATLYRYPFNLTHFYSEQNPTLLRKWKMLEFKTSFARNGTYLYHISSMPAHNCVPNSSWLIQLNSDFHLRAAVPIKAGESVNFLYTEATLDTYDRQKKLKESKYFVCGCARCSDPTELGTYFSATKCPEKNCVGYLLSGNGLNTPDSDWSCERCSNNKSSHFVRSLLSKIDQETGCVDQEDSFSSVEKLLKTSNKYSGVTLHSNHFKIHDIENDVLQRISFLLTQIGRANQNQYTNLEIKWATKLVELSRKCLKIADVIWPGFNRHRGRLLYFLQQGLIIPMLVAVHSSTKSKGKPPQDLVGLKQGLQEVQKIRQEVLTIFSIEPEGREESYIAKAMTDDSPEIVQLKVYCDKINRKMSTNN